MEHEEQDTLQSYGYLSNKTTLNTGVCLFTSKILSHLKFIGNKQKQQVSLITSTLQNWMKNVYIHSYSLTILGFREKCNPKTLSGKKIEILDSDIVGEVRLWVMGLDANPFSRGSLCTRKIQQHMITNKCFYTSLFTVQASRLWVMQVVNATHRHICSHIHTHCF